MMLSAVYLSAYYAACTPQIGRSTIAAIVQVESGGDPWAIDDNTDKRRWQARSYAEAVAIAQTLVRLGHSVDMGLAQVNSRNLAHLGMSVREVFEPCRNLRAAARILEDCYTPAANRFGPGQRALVHALSCYNTGSLYAGKSYVGKVLAAAGAAPMLRKLAHAELRGATSRTWISREPVVRWKMNRDWRAF